MKSSVFSSDSEDSGDEWNETNTKKASKKPSSKKQKFAPSGSAILNLEEGEISSEGLEDEEDDGLDENFIGGEDDKARLAKMSEKEREEEIFKRIQRREAILSRRAVKKRLKEKRQREKAATSKSTRPSKVFSSDSDQDESDQFNDSVFQKDGVRKRKIAMDKRKEETSNKLKELIEQRNKKQQRKKEAHSDDEKKHKKRSDVRLVYSSSDSDASQDDYSKKKSAAMSSSSRSSSPLSSEDDSPRGRSRSPVEERVTNVQQLAKIRLSRFKLEKWVHMPFFDHLVTGCYVRVNIGLNQGVPIYRCVEIADVVEGHKVYDFEKTRTNKCLLLKASNNQSTFRMQFVSNSEFTQTEFDKWMQKTTIDNQKPPTLAFIERKAKEIDRHINAAITDEKVVDQIIQTKKRFMKGPVNFAMRRSELLKSKDIADLDGDYAVVRRIDEELADIDHQAETLERRRTSGFRSIQNINQRNRMVSVQQAEDALKREAREAAESKEDDPYMRIQSRPVIWTKKNFELLKSKIGGKNDTDSKNVAKNTENGAVDVVVETVKNIKTSAPVLSSLHDIHNFDIDISVDIGGSQDPASSKASYSGDKLANNRMGTGTSGDQQRRMLNLDEYKRLRGLI